MKFVFQSIIIITVLGILFLGCQQNSNPTSAQSTEQANNSDQVELTEETQGAHKAMLTQGWDNFAEPLSMGKVIWNTPAHGNHHQRKLLVNFILSGADTNHTYTVGAHFFNPVHPLERPIIGGFGAAWYVGEDTLYREGDSAYAVAYDFGYLTTDSLGTGSAHFNFQVPPGRYFVQFTVRIGTGCPTDSCDVVYRTGMSFAHGFEVINIGGFPPPPPPIHGNRVFKAKLSGDNEVPPVTTIAKGKAQFKLSKNGNSLDYKLIVNHIDSVHMAHIHLGQSNENGPVVAWLYPSSPPPDTIPGIFNGKLAEGSITGMDLVGPLAGQPLGSLIHKIMKDSAYVNVHSVPNPAGEIRGQIEKVSMHHFNNSPN